MVLHGCATRRAIDTVTATNDACVIADSAVSGRVRVGVRGPVRAEYALNPQTDAEQFVHRQVYETLVRIDCNGDLAPGLARQWSVAGDGRTWSFRLRDGLTFSDGTLLTAAAVVDGWSARRIDTTFAEVVAAGPNELRIVVNASESIPHVLAKPQFAVTRHVAGGVSIGTGAYRIGASSNQQIRLLPRDATLPSIDVQITSADARFALDAGVDAVVSGDAATVEYARVLPGYITTALPWNRTYVLVAANDSTSSIGAAARAALARDAVRGEVRPAEPPFRWQATECLRVAASRVSATRAIAYPAEDGIARGLAERIAALTWPASRTPAWLRALIRPTGRAPTVIPMAEEALMRALRTDASLAAVIPVSRTGACGPAPSGTALVDARNHLLYRGSIGRVIVDGDGTLRFGATR